MVNERCVSDYELFLYVMREELIPEEMGECAWHCFLIEDLCVKKILGIKFGDLKDLTDELFDKKVEIFLKIHKTLSQDARRSIIDLLRGFIEIKHSKNIIFHGIHALSGGGYAVQDNKDQSRNYDNLEQYKAFNKKCIEWLTSFEKLIQGIPNLDKKNEFQINITSFPVWKKTKEEQELHFRTIGKFLIEYSQIAMYIKWLYSRCSKEHVGEKQFPLDQLKLIKEIQCKNNHSQERIAYYSTLIELFSSINALRNDILHSFLGLKIEDLEQGILDCRNFMNQIRGSERYVYAWVWVPPSYKIKN